MQGDISINGIDFEPIDDQRSRCSVCQKTIYKLLQKAHASSHSNSISAKQITKTPIVPIDDKPQSKGVKKISLQLEDLTASENTSKKSILQFDNIPLHDSSIKKPTLEFSDIPAHDLIPKKIIALGEKPPQDMINKKSALSFGDISCEQVAKKVTSNHSEIGYLENGTKRVEMQVDEVQRPSERDQSEVFIKTLRNSEGKNAESGNKLVEFEKMLREKWDFIYIKIGFL
ncbi:hypothetical protein SteCoe_24248 [Stentor coeruleus]|uniref:Uncharacterized protein n=1 Tax=Stentor coeruleus TaxID=5963 RepID=A0A1R2BI38_9CILI|nr:hypothetical protein SteCoe_24248 [Stentor coeruleus]